MNRTLSQRLKKKIGWPSCPWLPAPLWGWWRDLTWCAKKRAEYLAKMQRYYDMGGRPRDQAVDRVKRTSRLVDEYPWDWDDNIPAEWAMVLVRRWGLS